MSKASKVKRGHKEKAERALGWHPTPLKGSFMVLAILGFLVTAYIIYPILNINYSIAFMIIFAAMFIASLISMTKAPLVE